MIIINIRLQITMLINNIVLIILYNNSNILIKY